MESEPSHSPQDCHISEGLDEQSEESKRELPQKRQKFESKGLPSSEISQSASLKSVIVVAHTDVEAIKQFADIENSKLSRIVNSLKL